MIIIVMMLGDVCNNSLFYTLCAYSLDTGRRLINLCQYRTLVVVRHHTNGNHNDI